MSVVKPLLEKLRSLVARQGSESEPTGSITTFSDLTAGQHPEPSLSVLVDWYRRDVYVRYAVDAYANRIASKFYVVANDPETLSLVNDFLRRNRFVALNKLIARDVVLSGDAFLNVVPVEAPRAGLLAAPEQRRRHS